jgi:hypothetical protein
LHGRLSGDRRCLRPVAAHLLKPAGVLFLAFAASSGLSQTGEPPVDIVPVWEGFYRSGGATEITLVATVGNDTVLRAEVQGSMPVSTIERPLAAETAVGVGIAIRPSRNGLTVSSSLGNGVVNEHTLELRALSEALVAIVADDSTDLMRWLTARDNYRPLPVATTELPRTVAGYEPLSGIVIGRDPRADLRDEQRNALNAYLRNCGQVFTIDPATRTALSDVAGCDARFVILIREPGDIAARTRERVQPLPHYDQLRRLLGGPPRLIYVAAAFLALYCLFVAMLAARARPASTLLLLMAPVAAALLMLAVWSGNEPESRLLVWAEQTGQEPTRYRAVLELYSQGLGAIELPLSPEFGIPATISDAPTEFVQRTEANAMRWHPQLMSRLMLGMDGTAAPKADLVIDSAAAVHNRGAQPSPEALLAHEGRYYRVPSLAPDESWWPSEETPSLSRADVPAPLTTAGATAILMPLPTDRTPAELPRADSETGWLLQRAAAGRVR